MLQLSINWRCECPQKGQRIWGWHTEIHNAEKCWKLWGFLTTHRIIARKVGFLEGVQDWYSMGVNSECNTSHLSQKISYERWQVKDEDYVEGKAMS